MSLFVPMDLTCPSCGATITMDAVGSVNADRRPDLRDQIIENEFQVANCSECGHEFRLEPDFNYLDMGRGQWIAALPANQLRDHLEIADEKSEVFDVSYGANAPEAAKAIGESLKLRIVFGWPAMREKLVLEGAGLDDVVMEVAKLDLLRNLPEAPLAEGIDLRVVDVTDERLAFVWVEAESEEILNTFEVERSLYDEITENPDPWAPVMNQVGDNPFVDMQKLFMGEGRTDAAQ